MKKYLAESMKVSASRKDDIRRSSSVCLFFVHLFFTVRPVSGILYISNLSFTYSQYLVVYHKYMHSNSNFIFISISLNKKSEKCFYIFAKMRNEIFSFAKFQCFSRNSKCRKVFIQHIFSPQSYLVYKFFVQILLLIMSVLSLPY